MDENWMLLLAGLIPYCVGWYEVPDGTRMLVAKALFWTLVIYRSKEGHHVWAVSIPLIERLRDAMWAAVIRIRGDESSQI